MTGPDSLPHFDAVLFDLLTALVPHQKTSALPRGFACRRGGSLAIIGW